METNIFIFNGLARVCTMQEAIDFCRKRAIYENKSTALSVKGESGKPILLADYDPIDRANWEEYHEDPKDLRSPLVPQVSVKLAGFNQFELTI